jgi:hypothetical protein
LTTTATQIRFINITKFTEDTDRHVSGNALVIDSKGQDVRLIFAVDMGMETIEVALADNPHSYPAFNDRLLPLTAPDDNLGYVMVEPTYEHNVVTEVPASEHFWTEDAFKTMEKGLLDQIFVRWEKAKEAANAVFSDTLLGDA